MVATGGFEPPTQALWVQNRVFEAIRTRWCYLA